MESIEIPSIEATPNLKTEEASNIEVNTEERSNIETKEKSNINTEETPGIKTEETLNDDAVEMEDLNIVIAGCTHGDLEIMYQSVYEIELREGRKVDLILCCGDFQSTRNQADLDVMHVQDKYKKMKDFYKYYNGEKTAPYLTIFIGGNHEATSYLQELQYGGWVAKNIYYMGFCSVINFAGLRIGGVSGIYKSREYSWAHFECVPYDHRTSVSAYHTRSIEVFKLKQLKSSRLDIMLSHDWPEGIAFHGNINELFRMKKFLIDDIQNHCLGNPHTMEILNQIKPKYWYSAHLHVKYAALVVHEEKVETRFLSLDKPIPKRQFLHLHRAKVPKGTNRVLSYDLEWLGILRSTNEFTTFEKKDTVFPDFTDDRNDFSPTTAESDEIMAIFNNDLTIPTTFKMTAPPHSTKEDAVYGCKNPQNYANPQTEEFCNKLGLINFNAIACHKSGEKFTDVSYYKMVNVPKDSSPIQLQTQAKENGAEGEISLSDDEESDECCGNDDLFMTDTRDDLK
uniref:DBR1 domain-containing protein n=1 Tax=Rhabditophanes sp. KR3021 TaxID=114890 RepID=A0AC35TIN7_9BILA